MASTLFSSNDEDVIKRTLILDDKLTKTDENNDEFYEISRCVKWISDNNFKDVALQFPDEMLRDSVEISLKLRSATQAETYILADTSYGSCCVDEIAAEHISADCIIHYGHSCLSPTSRLPVLYIFGRRTVDIDDVEYKFKELFPDRNQKIICLSDVVYDHAMDSITTRLQPLYPNLLTAPLTLTTPTTPTTTTTITKLSRHFPSTFTTYTFFYIGHDDQSLASLILTFNKNPFFSYDPKTQKTRHETLNVNRTLSKRYYLVEKTRDAKMIGILIGTLGIADYLSIITRLKKIIKESGKKAYTLAMGKINVAKLANFPEIDVFVLVACPENSLIDSKDFFKPIVTPFEIEMACNLSREWSGDFVTDFRELLPGSANYVESEGVRNVDEEEPSVSLVTGAIRRMKISEDLCSDVVRRDGCRVVAPIHQNGAGEYLSNRSWMGLRQDLGEKEVAKAKMGRSGLAAAYENEDELYDNSKND